MTHIRSIVIIFSLAAGLGCTPFAKTATPVGAQTVKPTDIGGTPTPALSPAPAPSPAPATSAAPAPSPAPAPSAAPAPNPVPAPSPAPAPMPGMWTAAKFAGHGVRGFNSPGDTSSTSLSDMAATGANVVRVFVDLKRTPNTNTYTSRFANVDSVVSSGAKFGFKVILVFEPLPNQSSEEFWNNTGLQSSISDNWVAAATRYKGNTTVAGYDLINEPIAPSGQAQWMALASKLITNIRAVDPDHVIFYEPSPGAIPESFATMTSLLPFTNIVYSLHEYEPYQITHQGILSTTQATYPSPAGSALGLVNSTTLSNQLVPVRQFVAKFHVPLYVGEFSCVRWAPNNSAHNYISDSLALFEAEGYSWTYHSWREYQGWDAELPETFFYQFPYTAAVPQGWQNLNAATARSGTTDTMLALKRYFQANTP